MINSIRMIVLLFFFVSLKGGSTARPQTPQYKQFKDNGVTLEYYSDTNSYIKVAITFEDGFGELKQRTRKERDFFQIFIGMHCIAELEYFSDEIDCKQKFKPDCDETVLSVPNTCPIMYLLYQPIKTSMFQPFLIEPVAF